MRITQTHLGDQLQSTLQRRQADLAQIQQRISSNSRIVLGSDDPTAAMQLARLQAEKGEITQYQSNIDALSLRLKGHSLHLDDIQNRVMAVHDTMLSAADGTLSPSEKNAAAHRISELRTELSAISNSKEHDGYFVFSGTAAGKATVTYAPSAALGARYTFDGNQEIQDTVVGKGLRQGGNTALEEIAGLLNSLELAEEALKTAAPNAQTIVEAALTEAGQVRNSIEGKIERNGAALQTIGRLGRQHAVSYETAENAYTSIKSLNYVAAIEDARVYRDSMDVAQKLYIRMMSFSMLELL